MSKKAVFRLAVLAACCFAAVAAADGMRRARRAPPAPIAPSPEVAELMGGTPQPEMITPLAAASLDEATVAQPTDFTEEEVVVLRRRVLELGGYGPYYGSGGSGYTY